MDELEMQFRRAAYDAQCLKLMDDNGWFIQGVFPRDDTPPEKRYCFCYTVGLSRHGLAEFIEYGLDLEVGKVVLNELASKATRGTRYRPGTLIDFQNDFFGALLEAEDLSDLTMAAHFFGEIRALQLVFQDEEHRWPNDPDYGIRELPILGSFPNTLIREE